MLGCSPGKHVMRGTHFAFPHFAVGKIFHLSCFISVLLSEHTTSFLGMHLGWKNSLYSAGLPFEWEKPEAASERRLPSLFQSIRPSRSATEPGFLFSFYHMPEYSRKRGKNLQFLYFLRCFCMRRYQHNKIFTVFQKKIKTRLKHDHP